MMLNYFYFEQRKRVICHQQKASLWLRFHQSNHLCKLGKTMALVLSLVVLQHYFFPIQMFAHLEQLTETYLIESS